jgi:hypothetical protein
MPVVASGDDDLSRALCSHLHGNYEYCLNRRSSFRIVMVHSERPRTGRHAITAVSVGVAVPSGPAHGAVDRAGDIWRNKLAGLV